MKARAADARSDMDSARGAERMTAAGQLALRPAHFGARAFVLALSALVLVPILVLVILAFGGQPGDLQHLAATVLPKSALVTVELLAIVALLCASIGVTAAWLVVSFDFPARRALSWLLVLPAAMPTYIAAYGFVEFFHFAGPLQSGLRAVFGFHSARDYWFPNIRSLGGASVILSLVLYPYVYLAARAVFLMQNRHAADVARSLGASPLRVFWKVSLPMARPAIAAGVSLALMEALNDFGAVDYLGVRTLTFSVYNVWLAQGSLAGAAQLACAMLVFVFVLIYLEQKSRRNLRHESGRLAAEPRLAGGQRLHGWSAAFAFAACALPPSFGFGIPFFVISGFAVKRLGQLGDPQLHSAFFNSVIIGALTASLTVLTALGLVHARRLARLGSESLPGRLPLLGYCLPGTVLAVGVLFMLTAADNWFDGIMRRAFGYSTGLLLAGSVFGIVLACVLRFLAVGEGMVQAGLEKISVNLPDAARNLGQTANGAMRHITLPLLSPAIVTGFILVFVDTLKELSATILLRPLGFDTLATYVYESASRATVEQGAVAALAIIVTGMVPVLLLSHMSDKRWGT